MCFPNEPDELERIMRDSRVVDWFIDEFTRSPRAGEASCSFAPSPSATDAETVDNRVCGVDSLPPQLFDFDRDAQATGV